MVQDIGTTERQLDNHNDGRRHQEKTHCPASQDQLEAKSVVHNSRVVQGVADGNIPIKGHYCHVEKSAGTQAKEKQHLKKATRQGNYFPLCQKAVEGARNECGGECDFQNGKIPEEEVHWSLKKMVHKSDADNSNVSKQDQEVGNHQNQKEDDLQMAAVGQPQEDKFHYCCVVH